MSVKKDSNKHGLERSDYRAIAIARRMFYSREGRKQARMTLRSRRVQRVAAEQILEELLILLHCSRPRPLGVVQLKCDVNNKVAWWEQPVVIEIND